MAEEQLRIEERLEELEDNPPRYNYNTDKLNENTCHILCVFSVI